MCLIAIAHAATDRYPLVIAANRDEAYERPTHEAHVWTGASDVIGGRDAVHGGSWFAIRRDGRFAAVTNLRGAVQRERSRGFLVRDFVMNDLEPAEYAANVIREASVYSGFHLLVGAAGRDLVQVSSGTGRELAAGIYGISNAPEGERWEKVDVAIEATRKSLVIDDPDTLADQLVAFLAKPRGTREPQTEVFIEGEQYGTRSSTVVIVTAREILFVEQSYDRGGIARRDRVNIRFPRPHSSKSHRND